jgi:hypothetical protein
MSLKVLEVMIAGKQDNTCIEIDIAVSTTALAVPLIHKGWRMSAADNRLRLSLLGPLQSYSC